MTFVLTTVRIRSWNNIELHAVFHIQHRALEYTFVLERLVIFVLRRRERTVRETLLQLAFLERLNDYFRGGGGPRETHHVTRNGSVAELRDGDCKTGVHVRWEVESQNESEDSIVRSKYLAKMP